MEITGVTVGLPVSDLAASVAWYRRALEIDGAALEPGDGMVELQVGPVWLQLGQQDGPVLPGRTTTLLGVPDVAVQRQRLLGLGVEVGPVQEVPGVIAWCDLADPDGNRLGLYTEQA